MCYTAKHSRCFPREFIFLYYLHVHLLQIYMYVYLVVILTGGRDSLAGIATAGRPGFGSRYKPGMFLSCAAFRPALGPTKPPVQRAPGALSPEVKWPGREADHSPTSSAEVKHGEAIFSLRHTSS
jgi:hypothetical protein